MLRSALLTVPEALAHVGPTLGAYEASFGDALALDGVVYPPDAVGANDPLAEQQFATQAFWRVPSLVGARPLLGNASPADAAVVRECMRTADAVVTPQLGRAAREMLRARFFTMAIWVLEHHDESRGPIEHLANSQLYRVRRELLRRCGVRRLWLELRDQRQREAAWCDPRAREAYLAWWYRRIARLQRRLSWHVPGYSGEDVAGELLAQLIKAIDSGEDAPFVIGGAPG